MQKKYEQVKEIKARTDHLLTQLSEGRYASPDTYTNNLLHLGEAFKEYDIFTRDHEFLAWMMLNHAKVLAEISMTGRLIMAVQNCVMTLASVKK